MQVPADSGQNKRGAAPDSMDDAEDIDVRTIHLFAGGLLSIWPATLHANEIQHEPLDCSWLPSKQCSGSWAQSTASKCHDLTKQSPPANGTAYAEPNVPVQTAMSKSCTWHPPLASSSCLK